MDLFRVSLDMRSLEKNRPQRIYGDLKKKIQSGEFSVGERLPTEKELAASYGVAVLTLRKALALLKKEGWVVAKKYHGTHAANPSGIKRSSKILGLMIPYGLQTLSHPVFSRLVDGIEGIVSERGYELRLGISAWNSTVREKALLEMVENPEVVGWIIPTIISDAVRMALRKQSSDKVLLHFPDEEISQHCLQVDYDDLAKTVIDHLALQGYRKIFHLGPQTSENLLQAISAYVDTGIFGDKIVVRSVGTADYTIRSGKAGALKLLKNEEVDVFICGDDELAVGVFQALEEKGKKAPDVGVIGAGDFPIGMMTKPALSTISYPYFSVGRQAAQLLIDILEEKNVEPAHSRFVPKFIPRESTFLTSASEYKKIGII